MGCFTFFDNIWLICIGENPISWFNLPRKYATFCYIYLTTKSTCSVADNDITVKKLLH